MLNVGIVGVGYLGNFHLDNLLKHQNINVAGFFDIDAHRSEFISKKYNVKSFQSRQSLFDDCQAVCVVTPTQSHFEIAQDALLQGLHVFCEKPVTERLEQAEKLMKIAESKNLVLQVGHIERFNPALRILKGLKVNPKFIECHRISEFNKRGVGSAVIPELMIHDLDIILKLVDSKIKTISASGTPVLTNNVDIANVRIAFENGCIANVTASRISDKKIRKFRIFQENAYINIDFLNKKTEIYTLDKTQYNSGQIDFDKPEQYIKFFKPEIPEANAMFEEQVDFIKSILNQETPIVTARDGFVALSLALQIEDVIRKNLENN